MTDSINPAAPRHVPWFITAPGQSDGLFTAMIIFLIVVLLLIGVLYFKLHALPEHIAHGATKGKMDFVMVLAVLAMFTHQNLFWIAALLIAFVELPDFSSPISSMARSLQRLARADQLSVPHRAAIAEPEPEKGSNLTEGNGSSRLG
jgi:hypothetical protein